MTFNELLELDKRETAASSRKAPPQPSGARRAIGAKAGGTIQSAASGAESDAMKPGNHATTVPRRHDTSTPALVKRVRKSVKQVGKEAATHRFTREEKESVADIVYTYGRQGYRSSENEITRIGLNWLIEDYRENGKRSLLHRVLRALKE